MTAKGWLMGTPAPIHLAPLRYSRYTWICLVGDLLLSTVANHHLQFGEYFCIFVQPP